MSITLDDIAKRAGVVKSTVSCVLRNHSKAQNFNEDVRQRILQAAAELNYRPNFFASQLRRTDKQVLMLCLSYLEDEYSAKISEAIISCASERGYKVFVSILQENEDIYEWDREVLGGHGISAMIIVGGAPHKFSDEAIIRIANEGVKIVTVGRAIECEFISQVVVDNVVGASKIAAYAYNNGVSKAVVVTPNIRSAIAQRAETICDTATKLGMPNPKIISTCDSSSEEGYQAVRKYLSENELPDGIFAVTDSLALGTMRAVFESGYKVGQDVAVFGYDNIRAAAFTCPALTTVSQPMVEMGITAADLLIQTIENKIRLGRKIVLSPEIVIRQSGQLRQTGKMS